MARILSLETATSICSVAVHENDKLLGVSEIHQEQAHGAKLALLVDNLRNVLGIELSSIDAIAVSAGPGSYTGLRIGVSTAKGLCYALGLPLVSVNTLEIMALKVQRMGLGNSLLCPMLDARRMEVYSAVYDLRLNVVQDVAATEIDGSSFGDLLEKHNITFFGNGAAKCQGVITHPGASFISNIYPSAVELGQLAGLRFQQGNREDLVGFEPIYLKEFLIKKPKEVLNK